MSISTRTVCAFPFTFNNSVIDILREDETALNLTIHDCVQTIGEALGDTWMIYRGACGAVFTLFFFAFSVQLFRLRDFAKRVHRPYFSLVQSKIFGTCLMISLAMVIQSIDPQGFENILNPVVSFMCDEVIATSLFVLAMLVADFWAQAAKGMKRNSRGLPKRFRIPFVICVAINFLGFEIAGIILYEEYFLYEAIKSFGAILLLVILGYFAFINVDIIRRALEDMHSKSSSSASPDSDGEQKPKGLKKVSSLFKLTSSEKSPAQIIIAKLKAKYRKFFAVIFFAILVLLANGLIALSLPDLSWGYSILELPDAVQMILKLVYALCLVIGFHFFRVPFAPKRNSPSKTDDSSSTKNRFDTTTKGLSRNDSSGYKMAAFNSGRKAVKIPKPRKRASSAFSVYEEEFETFEANAAKSLKVELSNPSAAFLKFCDEHKLEDVVNCYAAILKFEQLFSSESSPAVFEKAGNEIMEKYMYSDVIDRLEASLVKLSDDDKFLKDSFRAVKKSQFKILRTKTLEFFAQNASFSETSL